MAAASASANRGADSGDDWEYDYDDTETQDVYLSLDLTSHTTVAAPKKGFNKLEHDIFAEDARASNKNRNQGEDADEEDEEEEEQGDHDIEVEEDGEDEDRLQIVGLHHDNPIISYKGQAYTCKWASTIGTDLFFARAPDVDPEFDDEQPAPLAQLGTFNMVGASSTRLVATAAKLRERTSAEQRGTTTAGPSSGAVASSSSAPAAKPSSLPYPRTTDFENFFVPSNATRAQKRQASFLANFAAVKARLGEEDNVRATSFTSRGFNRVAAADREDDEAAGPSTPRRTTNGRQSVSFLSARDDILDPTPGNAVDSPQSPASAASPSIAEPAPTRGRGRGRGRVGRPRSRGGRGRGRGRSRARGPRGPRGRGRRAAVVEDHDGDGDGDVDDAGESVPTPGIWGDAMTDVETGAVGNSVGSVLQQQQQQQQQQESRDRDAMQE